MTDPIMLSPFQSTDDPSKLISLKNTCHDLAYLDLSGLPLKRNLYSSETIHCTLAYLHLNGPLSEIMLSPRFRTFYDKFIPIKLDDYITIYCNKLERRYKRTGETRCLEVLVTMYERFDRLKTKAQKSELFERVFENLYKNRCEDGEGSRRVASCSCLKNLLETLQKQTVSLTQLHVWSLDASKLEFFLSRTKNCFSVQDPGYLLMEAEDPVHRYFMEASISSLTLVLNHGIEQKINNRRLKWYLKRILTRKKEYCCEEDFFFWYNYFQTYGITDRDYLLRRLFLTLQLLYVILYRIPEDLRDCLRLLWKTIPDTYITAEELDIVMREMPIRKKMAKSYDAFLNSSKYREIKKYINRARDLKHYSRCRIRACLIQNRTLPEGIQNLHLPKELESYMLLESGGSSTHFVPV